VRRRACGEESGDASHLAGGVSGSHMSGRTMPPRYEDEACQAASLADDVSIARAAARVGHLITTPNGGWGGGRARVAPQRDQGTMER